MGLNTAVVILNDYLHRLEDDPAFAAGIAGAIRDNGRDPWKHNGFGVLPSVHADYEQIVVIGGNTITSFDDLPQDKAEVIIRKLAERRGMRVRKAGTPRD